MLKDLITSNIAIIAQINADIETIELLKGHFPDLKVNFIDIRPGDVKDSQNDPLLLKQLFPSVMPTDFPTALSETVGWLKEFGQSVANGPATVD